MATLRCGWLVLLVLTGYLPGSPDGSWQACQGWAGCFSPPMLATPGSVLTVVKPGTWVFPNPDSQGGSGVWDGLLQTCIATQVSLMTRGMWGCCFSWPVQLHQDSPNSGTYTVSGWLFLRPALATCCKKASPVVATGHKGHLLIKFSIHFLYSSFCFV